MSTKHHKRVVYLDYLRVIATFAVIILHVSSIYWDELGVSTRAWNIMNFYDAGVRWGVGIFVMISGVLFCSREASIEKLYKKNIFRMVVAFLFWSLFYALFNVITQGYEQERFFRDLILGEYHMWFLFMIVGLYMIVPFLKKITESKQLLQYFLILCLIFGFLIPSMIDLLTIISVDAATLLEQFVAKFKFNFVLGYVGYFVLGYYLSKQETKKPLLYYVFLGLVGYGMTYYFTKWSSLYLGEPCRIFYDNLTINVLLMSVSVFLVFKKVFAQAVVKSGISRLMIRISDYSFGIYLVHIFILRLFEMSNVTALTIAPLRGVLVISLLIFVISYAISALFHHLPIVKKYLC